HWICGISRVVAPPEENSDSSGTPGRDRKGSRPAAAGAGAKAQFVERSTNLAAGGPDLALCGGLCIRHPLGGHRFPGKREVGDSTRCSVDRSRGCGDWRISPSGVFDRKTEGIVNKTLRHPMKSLLCSLACIVATAALLQAQTPAPARPAVPIEPIPAI